MIIKTFAIRNFRSIVDQRLDCGQLTVLVGPNGAGKSSFLRALELFYAPNPRCDPEDFYDGNTSRTIEIAVTFTDLNESERGRFAKYVQEGELNVVRVIDLGNGKVLAKYHGYTLRHPPFEAIRSAGGKKDIKAKYNQVRERSEYADLPEVSTGDAVLEELAKWEAARPDQCERVRDDGQFFGITEAAHGQLGHHTRLIPVPAVRDASVEASEGRGSAISEIVDLVVRSVLATQPEFVQLKQELSEKYEQILKPENLPQLRTISEKLTETLKTYVADSAVRVSWDSAVSVDIPLPKAAVRLVEDGYECTVDRTGHGLQRAFLLTLLQYLTALRSTTPGTSEAQEPSEEPSETGTPQQAPDLVLTIEEPELYQHPNRQRHLAKVLYELAASVAPGGWRTQVLYTTHSPLLVGIDRFDDLRVLRKVPGETGKPGVTRGISTSLDYVAEQLWIAAGKPPVKFTATSLRARLQALMTPWVNEGFFAETAVLVEGEQDRAAILGVAAAMGRDLERDGISVIPCLSKENLDRPLVIFTSLQIPAYVVWDSDEGGKDAKPDTNRCLLRLLGQSEEDWPDHVADSFACFRHKLEVTLQHELGADVFEEALKEAQAELGILKKERALKNALVIQKVIGAAKSKAQSSSTLEGIIERIVAVRTKRSPTESGNASGSPSPAVA